MANARRLLHAARALAPIESYGAACSLLVLSVEEAVKSWVFEVISLVPALASQFQPLLQLHRARHSAALVGALSTAFSIRMSELIDEAESRFTDRTEEEGRLARQYVFEALIEDSKLAVKADPTENVLIDTMDWLADADSQKIRGFYTDYVGGAWTSPASTSVEEYERANRVAGRIIEHVQLVLTALSELSPEDRTAMAGQLAGALKAVDVK